MATNTQIKPPREFDFNKPKGWVKWIEPFNRCRIASGLHLMERNQQVNTLLYTMEEAGEIMKGFTFKKTKPDDYSNIREKFNKHFTATRNMTFERAKFNMRKQEPHESVESFITALYTLSEHCEFGTLRNQIIRDRIVVRLADTKLSENLQLESKLTLEKAIEIAAKVKP